MSQGDASAFALLNLGPESLADKSIATRYSGRM